MTERRVPLVTLLLSRWVCCLKKDWGGVWIGGGDLLRNHIIIKEKVKRARAYICGLGWYELRINGLKVGDHQLDPGLTDYDKVALYSTFDITDFLKNDETPSVSCLVTDGMLRIGPAHRG